MKIFRLIGISFFITLFLIWVLYITEVLYAIIATMLGVMVVFIHYYLYKHFSSLNQEFKRLNAMIEDGTYLKISEKWFGEDVLN